MTQLRKLFGGYLMVVPAFLAAPDVKRRRDRPSPSTRSSSL